MARVPARKLIHVAACTWSLDEVRWLPEYLGGGPGGWRNNLYGDIFAGCTTATFLVPQGMSYALVANMDPVYGLYCATIPLIVYGFFGSSRQLSMGPVAIVSLLIGHGLQEITPPRLADGSANPVYVKLAVSLAFFAGLLQLLMGLFKMGFVTRLLSHPVLSGFTSAAALIIGSGQLKHVLAFSPKSSDNIFVVWADIVGRLRGEAHWPSTVLGAATVALMLLFKHAPPLKKLPAAMIVVVMGVVVSWAMELGETHGFKIAGDIPTGIPIPATPAWPPSQHFGQIITLSVVTTMIGYLESVVVMYMCSMYACILYVLCMYVCMYVCVYVCMYVMYVCNVCVYECM